MDKVPYMQRGGAWDDSDLTKKGAAKMAARKEIVVNNNKTSKKITKKQWSETDKAYANVRIPLPRGRSALRSVRNVLYLLGAGGKWQLYIPTQCWNRSRRFKTTRGPGFRFFSRRLRFP